MIDAGVPMAISTDFNRASSPTISLSFIRNLTCVYMDMTMEEGLTATIINATSAINRGGQISSLECGKKADVLILGVSNYK